MQTKQMFKAAGFTIVELVVVIILLGILAATALPRFIDLDDEANAAAFSGVLGGFQTGVALYHAQYMANGEPPAGTQIPEFSDLRTNAQGYPYSTTSTTGNVIATNADCSTVFQGLLQAGPTVSVAPVTTATNTDYAAARESDTSCAFYYTGQNNNTGETIPMLRYNAFNGVVSRDTYTIP
ncbi:MAG: type II secretion system protein [Pseudomonadota bacterium]